MTPTFVDQLHPIKPADNVKPISVLTPIAITSRADTGEVTPNLSVTDHTMKAVLRDSFRLIGTQIKQ